MSLKLINGPELWSKLRDAVPDTLPNIVIAGGCVRDWYLGKTPKDIDVFYQYHNDGEGGYIDFRTLESYGLPFKITDNHDEPSAGVYDSDPDTNTISFIEDYWIGDEEIQLNVIGLKCDPLEYMYQFDLGTCRALYDGNLFFTGDFMQDMINKTVTIFRPEDAQRTKSRAERFIQNNKDFKIVYSSEWPEGSKDTPALP